ncbi:MAG: glycosyltransferase [Terriglobales bacterium]
MNRALPDSGCAPVIACNHLRSRAAAVLDPEITLLPLMTPADIVENSGWNEDNATVNLATTLSSHYRFDPDSLCWRRPAETPFLYSDGQEAEERLLAIIREARDLSSTSVELKKHATDWPSTYHLHPRRSNLLRPIRNLLRGTVLEVGAGCGALTRFLGEGQIKVVAVEGSARRAAVAASRCRDLPDVRVVVDTFEGFPIHSEYDAVLLVGVLEYARKFFSQAAGDPVDAVLRRARPFLKPGGVLILAIENQLGLKYFAGFREDHTGEVGTGIEDRYVSGGVVTFGRKELEKRIHHAGFSHMSWWYPFPDYKLPLTIVSERALAGDFNLYPLVCSALGGDPRTLEALLFSPEQVYRPVIRNGLLGDLANSFLVVASGREIDEDRSILACHYAVDRRPQFAKEVCFTKSKDHVRVRTNRLFPAARPEEDIPLSLSLQDEDLAEGTQWSQELQRILDQPGWGVEELAAWARVWFEALQERVPVLCASDALTKTTPLAGVLFDAVPHNLFVSCSGEKRFIDQEWRLSVPVELGYVIFRACLWSLLGVNSCASPSPVFDLGVGELLRHLAEQLGICLTDKDLQRYLSRERDLMQWASGAEMRLSLDYLKELRLPVRPNLNDIWNHSEVVHERDQFRVRTVQLDAQLTELRLGHGQTIAELESLRENHLRMASDIEASQRDHSQALAALRKTTNESVELRVNYEKTAEELRAKSAVLNQIYSSFGWKLLSIYYRIRQRILAPRASSHSRQRLQHFRERFRLFREERFVAASGVFDSAWYLQQNPDVAAAGINPLKHYLLGGAIEGRDPNPYFDSDWYLRQNPDVVNAGVNPLLHFLRFGGQEGRDPSPRFNCDWYLRQNTDVAKSGGNPLAHFLRHGASEGRSPRPFHPGDALLSKHPESNADVDGQPGNWLQRAFSAVESKSKRRRKIVLSACAAARADRSDTQPLRDYRRRLICVTHVLPYPSRAGNEYRIHRMLSWLDAHGVEVFLVICPLPDQSVSVQQLEALSSVYSNLIVCQRDGTLSYCLADGDEAIRGLAGRTPTDFAKRLVEEGVGSKAKARMLPILRTFCPDILLEVLTHLDVTLRPNIFQLEYVFMARVLPLLRAESVKVVDTHDVFSTKYDKVSRFDIKDGLCLTPEEEGSLLEGADLVIAIQEDEAGELRRLASGKAVVTVGIDFDPVVSAIAPSTRPVILLVASGNPQNTKGLRDFLRFAWPIIKREVRDAELRIVGSVGMQMEADDPAIKILGLVDDLSAAYAEARVVINPAVAGTGLKIKTIEALCHLRPLVTWPSGVDGVDPEMRKLCHVATDWYSFTRQVIDLCSDDRALKTLANELANIQNRFSADAVYAALGTKLESLTAQ